MVLNILDHAATDILLNVFLAIAVDNLGGDEDEEEKKEEEEKVKEGEGGEGGEEGEKGEKEPVVSKKNAETGPMTL